MKALLLTLSIAAIFMCAGIASAQDFTGIHYTGSACYPYNVSGEANCSYVGNITNDPYASYAYLSDSTGVPAITIYPRVTPPAVNETGNWSGTFTWQNGSGGTGVVIIANGTCNVQGGPVGPYQATYTVSCSGVDMNGNSASKYQEYVSYKETGRGGAFWQPLVMLNPYGDQSHWGSVSFTAIGSVPIPDGPITK